MSETKKVVEESPRIVEVEPPQQPQQKQTSLAISPTQPQNKAEEKPTTTTTNSSPPKKKPTATSTATTVQTKIGGNRNGRESPTASHGVGKTHEEAEAEEENDLHEEEMKRGEIQVESTIAFALREIKEHKIRILELEDLIRRLAHSYGIDTDSLFAENQRIEGSEHGSNGLAGRNRGLIVLAPPSPPLPVLTSQQSFSSNKGKGRIHPETDSTTSNSSTTNQQSQPPLPPQSKTTQSTTQTQNQSPPGGKWVSRRPSVDSEEKVRRIMNKLQRLTGRRESIEELGPLLNPRTADEAFENGRMIRAADHFKRMYGTRPTVVQSSANLRQRSSSSSSVTSTTNKQQNPNQKEKEHKEKVLNSSAPDPNPNPNSQQQNGQQQQSEEVEIVEVNDQRPSTSPGDGNVNGNAGNLNGRRRSRSQNAVPAVADRKIDKLTKLTGRRASLADIVGLLYPQTPDEAKTNAQSLYTMEHLKKRYGQRPTVSQAKKTVSFDSLNPQTLEQLLLNQNQNQNQPSAAVPRSPSMPSLSGSANGDDDAVVGSDDETLTPI